MMIGINIVDIGGGGKSENNRITNQKLRNTQNDGRQGWMLNKFPAKWLTSVIIIIITMVRYVDKCKI